MPRTRRSGPTRRGATALTDDDRDMLTIGDCFFRFGAARLPSDAGLQRLWELHGARLVAECIEARPGGRPWGWWQYDAPDVPRGADEPPIAWLVRIGEVDAAELARWEARRRERAAAVARDLLASYGYAEGTYEPMPVTLPAFVKQWQELREEDRRSPRPMRDKPWGPTEV